MTDMIAGPGQGLPPPQALYPRLLWTSPFTAPTNRVMLQSGQSLVIPAGTWIVHAGSIPPAVLQLEWHDPVTREWFSLNAIPPNGQFWGMTVRSQGFDYRIANISGVPTHATVTSGGDNYIHSTTHCVPSHGDSRWRVIVGGALGPVTIIEEGKNYSIPPHVFVPAPPHPGVCALGHSVLTDGRVTGIIWDNPGAGYPFAPPILIIPDMFDPVLLAAADRDHDVKRGDLIDNARAKVELAHHRAVTAVLLERAGVSMASAPSLIISGQGTGAQATVQPNPWIAPANEFAVIQPSSGP